MLKHLKELAEVKIIALETENFLELLLATSVYSGKAHKWPHWFQILNIQAS